MKLTSNLGAYLKSKTYTKSEIDELVAGLGFKAVVVESLPDNPSERVIYLIPKTGSGDDVHDEYVWDSEDEKFELLGSTEIDLSDYYSKSEVNGLLNGKANTNHTHTISEINNLQNTLNNISGGGSSITVDDTLSSTSTNPVQNKVIKEALDDLTPFVYEIVESLPSLSNASSNKVYLVTVDAEHDLYDEYMVIDGAFVKLSSVNTFQLTATLTDDSTKTFTVFGFEN